MDTYEDNGEWDVVTKAQDLNCPTVYYDYFTGLK
jgi:hypothetical protein